MGDGFELLDAVEELVHGVEAPFEDHLCWVLGGDEHRLALGVLEHALGLVFY